MNAYIGAAFPVKKPVNVSGQPNPWQWLERGTKMERLILTLLPAQRCRASPDWTDGGVRPYVILGGIGVRPLDRPAVRSGAFTGLY